MQVIKSQLALIADSPQLATSLADQEPVRIYPKNLSNTQLEVTLAILALNEFTQIAGWPELLKKLNQEIQQIVVVADENDSIPIGLSELRNIRGFVSSAALTTQYILHIFEEIKQAEQDQVYINLSTELNEQYEAIKIELQNKLSEKSQHIIESRKQIYEINNRVEMLRKTLYSTTQVKDISQAEAELNDLLVKFGMVTWLKIVPLDKSAQFENEIRAQFESTLYSTRVGDSELSSTLFFFKGDKRPFRKSDINYFNKLTEALQINLNRFNKLTSLQKSERLFDLAFHSSPQPIIVVDKEYNVYQANLAAEKHQTESESSVKCYSLLFGRSKPCLGCQFGTRFEVQKDLQTFAVQSNRFSEALESEAPYWIHLYEDISEQKALESKFQQAAKLSEVGLISSSIAHELNNPLGGIISYLQIMKIELPADHPFQQDIQFLNEAAQRMKKHIEDLLFFSRKGDSVTMERVELHDILTKNLDLLQMQLKKEHLVVAFAQPDRHHYHEVPPIHFRNIVHLVFQFFIHKLKIRRSQKPNFNGMVEIKISQDQSFSYLTFNANLGPHDMNLSSNDLSLITLEKSSLDVGYQMVLSEPQFGWLQVLIRMPLAQNN